MKQWDSAAAERLDVLVADLRARGVVDVARDLADKVWRANLQRYEPRELGDTTRWLGMSAAGDLTQLLGRHYAGANVRDSTGVSACWPDGALVLKAGGVRMHVMKAPASPLRTPAWGAFAWSTADSQSRLLSARRNSAQYAPADSDQDGRPPMLSRPEECLRLDSGLAGQQDPLWGPGEDPARLCDVMLVWSGEQEHAVTAGWLGLPSEGSPPWFAVAPLWWDEAPLVQAVYPEPFSNNPTGDTFNTRPQPQLDLGLKRRPAASAAPLNSAKMR